MTKKSLPLIIVLNGSPKAKQSITLQHIKLFMQQNTELDFEVINISSPIKKIENDLEYFQKIVGKITRADAVIWSFPVYYALIPSQMKRFIELLFERCDPDIFKDKYTTSFTTSINFFDHTAHNYMHGVCEDLGFQYVKSYSAHMDDFFKKDHREKMMVFFEWFIEMVNLKIKVPRKYHPIDNHAISYEPGSLEEIKKIGGRKILLLTDAKKEDFNLIQMTNAFITSSTSHVEVKNIRDIEIKNGCLGCCLCGYDNQCIQKDEFRSFYNDNLLSASAIIFAGTVKDHYLSSMWKKFLDRSFFNGHSPVLHGKPLGFIISGHLSQVQNLRESLEALTDIWHMKSYGFVTDEYETSEEITDRITAFSHQFELADQKNLEHGHSFYHVAGKKIFRDFIYNASAVFRADNIFYKKLGFYDDFPQKKIRKRLSNAMFSFFLSIKPVRKKIHQEFIPGMVAPYKKVLKKL